jgi:hypothetical protein
MTVTELYPQVQLLPHADKLRLMQFLIGEFAREEHISLENPVEKSANTNLDALKTIADIAQPFAKALLAIPDVGLDSDFERINTLR